MRLSFFQVVFLLILFIVLFSSRKSFILGNFTTLLNSFLRSLKKHNSIRK